MERNFPHLYAPITLGRTTFRNRMFSAPMGGPDGLYVAYTAAKRGHQVILCEKAVPDANVRHRLLMLKRMEELKDDLIILTDHKVLKVTVEGLVCEDPEGKEVLVAGPSVICALGQRSRAKAVEELYDTAPWVRVIGDAARASTITNAVYWGYHAALDI